MGLEAIIILARDNVMTIVLAVIAIGTVTALLLTISGVKFRRQKPSTALSPNELRFRNVFAMMPEDRRQSLISYYSQKHECGREEAMRHAVEDRARDEGRW